MASRDYGSLLFQVTSVTQDGKFVADITQDVTGVVYSTGEKGSPKLTLTVTNQLLQHFQSYESMRWYSGMYISVLMGYQNNYRKLEVFRIKDIKGSTTLTVEATHKGANLNTSKATKSWKKLTKKQIVEQLAQKYDVPVAQLEDDGRVYDRITQANETDAEFMHRLAYNSGKQFCIDVDGMHMSARKLAQPPVKDLVYHISKTGEIIDFELTRSVTKLPARVTAKAIDRDNHTIVEHTADNVSDSNREVLADNVGYITVEGTTNALDVDVDTANVTSADAKEVENDAKARFRLAQQRSIQMNIDIVGDPDITPRSIIMLSGLGNILSGRYYVKSISSKFSYSEGFRETLEVVSDGVNRKGAGTNTGNGSLDVYDCMYGLSSLLASATTSSPFYERLKAVIDYGAGISSSKKNFGKAEIKKLTNKIRTLLSDVQKSGLTDQEVSNITAALGACTHEMDSYLHNPEVEEVANGVKENAKLVMYLTQEGTESAGTIDEE